MRIVINKASNQEHEKEDDRFGVYSRLRSCLLLRGLCSPVNSSAWHLSLSAMGTSSSSPDEIGKGMKIGFGLVGEDFGCSSILSAR